MKIYYIIDEQTRVIPCCDYSEEIEPDENWFIGEINSPAYDGNGIPLYKQADGKIVTRTDDEIQKDRDEIPEPEPTDAERIEAQVIYTAIMTDTLLEE